MLSNNEIYSVTVEARYRPTVSTDQFISQALEGISYSQNEVPVNATERNQTAHLSLLHIRIKIYKGVKQWSPFTDY